MTSHHPFSHAYYRSMLEQCIDAGYQISSFDRYDASAKRTIILRHDIDYTMDGVRAFAAIERELGCTASYLFRVHADEYNVFACTTWSAIASIRDMGHEIGLHFEAMNVGRALGIDPLALFNRERAVLEAVLGHEIQTCSEHRELSGTIHQTPLFEERYDIRDLKVRHYAMAPAYTREMKYLSDSNAHWREGDLLEHINEHPRIQALIHPDWWFENDLLLKGPYYHPEEHSPMNSVYVTSCDNGYYGLRHLVSKGLSPTRVVTIAPEVAVKNRVSGYRDIRADCESWDMPLTVLDSYQLTTANIELADPDLLIVNGWNRLIDSAVIAMFSRGGLGVHAGHPPVGLGRAPLPWNLIKGMPDLEVYVFRLTPRADDGDIVGKRTIEITPFDDVQLLYEKVMYGAALLLEDAVRAARADDLSGSPQNLEDAVFYPKRTPKDGLIDFCASVGEIYNFVRAQTTPYPGAYTYMDDAKWHIWHAVPFDTFAFRERSRRPGEILAALPSGLVVQTGTSPLWILHATSDRDTVPDDLGRLEDWVGRRFHPPAK